MSDRRMTTSQPRYAVGIDLGTTHTVVAYAAFDAGGAEAAGADPIGLFLIDQLIAPGEVAGEPLLPSVRYHPVPGELAPGDTVLPWPAASSAVEEPAADREGASAAGDGEGLVADAPPAVVGRLARRLGAAVPGRLVASAKSWLSHGAVDRLAPILPWGAEADVPRVSPVTASASYLAHVRAAWDRRFPDAPLARQEIVLTVPASFDDAARSLTVEAAGRAGLKRLRLLEEPQAACHDWLFRHRHDLAAQLAGVRLLLVVDVGGGTTDLSLIRVEAAGEGGRSGPDGEPAGGPGCPGSRQQVVGGAGAADGAATLVPVPADDAPRLTRIAVGQHLMLGGDNMDLALAHVAEARLAQQQQGQAGDGGGRAGRLSAARLAQLVERCRDAKEKLLAADAPERATVTLLGGGARLIGAARSVELTRDEVRRIVVDGFFPRTAAGEEARRVRGALVEFGLPYAADPAVTRHVSGFLKQHAAAAREALGDDAPPMPDALLLNGGVFRADALARRLHGVLGDWRGAPLRWLHNADPDVAVARGAVAHALTARRRAPAIGGGSARSYFLVLDDVGDAGTRGAAQATGPNASGAAGPTGGSTAPIPTTAAAMAITGGAASAAPPAARPSSPTRRGICLLPQGTESGREIRLEGRTFALRTGRPVRFRLVAATASAGARPKPGELVDLDAPGAEYAPLPPVATVVAPQAGGDDRRDVPVQLAAALTEVGTLELHCVAVADPSRRWRLDFQLRGEGVAPDVGGPARSPRFADALAKIERVFGARARDVTDKEVRQLRSALEALLGPRERWATPLLRELFDALMKASRGRRRSADHERLWLNLAGYCLRPGFGAPLDDWRIGQLWPLFEGGVQHGRDARVAAEWWTLWRRVAGGLPEDAQLRLLDDFAINLQGAEAGIARPPHTVPGGDDDMVRLGASLERVPVGHKVEIGDWLVERLRPAAPAPASASAVAASPPRGGTGSVRGTSAARDASQAARGAASDIARAAPDAAEGRTLWAIGRLGARQPFHGSAHRSVPPEDALRWLAAVEALDWRRTEAAAFAAAHLARRTGDRARDLPPEVRERVARRLEATHAAPSWIALVRDGAAAGEAVERQLFGESLPPGLKLIG